MIGVKGLKTLSQWLVIIGGLNWGLVGFFKWDLVAKLLGSGDPTAIIPRIVYAIVGLAAIVLIVTMSSSES